MAPLPAETRETSHESNPRRQAATTEPVRRVLGMLAVCANPPSGRGCRAAERPEEARSAEAVVMAADYARSDNPLKFPPCECERCRPKPTPAPGGDSALLLALRARMTEENGARRWVRGQS